MSKRTASDAMGWNASMIQSLAHPSASTRQQLLWLLNTLVTSDSAAEQGFFLPELMEIWNGGYMIPIWKPSVIAPRTKLRTIVAQNSFTKLVASTVDISCRTAIEQCIGENNLIYRKSACQVIPNATRTMLESDEDAIYMTTDMKDAFPAAKKNFVYEVLLKKARSAPLLIQCFRAKYGNPAVIAVRMATGKTQFIKSADGLHQGCPLSMAYYAMAYAVIAEEAKLRIWQDNGHTIDDMSFADDLGFVTKQPAACFSYVDMIEDISKNRNAGIHHSLPKTFYYASPDAATQIKKELRERLPCLSDAEICEKVSIRGAASGGLKSLNVAIGSQQFVHREIRSRLDRHIAFFNRVKMISNKQVAGLLIRYRANHLMEHDAKVYTLEQMEPFTEEYAAILEDVMNWLLDTKLEANQSEKIFLPMRNGGFGVNDPRRAHPIAKLAAVADMARFFKDRARMVIDGERRFPFASKIWGHMNASQIVQPSAPWKTKLIKQICEMMTRIGPACDDILGDEASNDFVKLASTTLALQRVVTSKASQMVFDQALSCMADEDKRWLLSAASDGASTFLQVIPSDYTKKLSNSQYEVACKLRFNLQLASGCSITACACGMSFPSNAHMAGCSSISATPRHEILRQAAINVSRSAGFATQLREPRGPKYMHDAKPNEGADILIRNYWGGRDSLVDVFVVNPQVANTPLSAVKSTDKRKADHYKPLIDKGKYSFIPMGMESTGALSPALRSLLKKLPGTPEESLRPTEWFCPSDRVHARQQLVMAVVRETSNMVIAVRDKSIKLWVQNPVMSPAAASVSSDSVIESVSVVPALDGPILNVPGGEMEDVTPVPEEESSAAACDPPPALVGISGLNSEIGDSARPIPVVPGSMDPPPGVQRSRRSGIRDINYKVANSTGEFVSKH
jgi:hypothetical protein